MPMPDGLLQHTEKIIPALIEQGITSFEQPLPVYQ